MCWLQGYEAFKVRAQFCSVAIMKDWFCYWVQKKQYQFLCNFSGDSFAYTGGVSNHKTNFLSQKSCDILVIGCEF